MASLLPFELPLPESPELSVSSYPTTPRGLSEDSLQALVDVCSSVEPITNYKNTVEMALHPLHDGDVEAYLLPHEKKPQNDTPEPLFSYENLVDAPTFGHEEANVEAALGEVEQTPRKVFKNMVAAAPRRRSSASATRPAEDTDLIPVLPEAMLREGNDDEQISTRVPIRRTSTAPPALELDSIAQERQAIELIDYDETQLERMSTMCTISEAAEEDSPPVTRRQSMPVLYSGIDSPQKHVAFAQASASAPHSPNLLARDYDDSNPQDSIVLYDITAPGPGGLREYSFPLSYGDMTPYLIEEGYESDSSWDDDDDDDWSASGDEPGIASFSNFNPWITGGQRQRAPSSHFPNLERVKTELAAWTQPSHHKESSSDSSSSIDPIVDEILSHEIIPVHLTRELTLQPAIEVGTTSITTSIQPPTPGSPPNSYAPSDPASPSLEVSTIPTMPPNSPISRTHRSHLSGESSDSHAALPSPQPFPQPPADLPQRIQRTLSTLDPEAEDFRAHKDSVDLAMQRLGKGRMEAGEKNLETARRSKERREGNETSLDGDQDLEKGMHGNWAGERSGPGADQLKRLL
ncbi:MAG: hypothetical protein M1820_005835 [Bogoriella megaspora]|nr:MAG: hypothetical protein M1820_005835 [Bogoriella megaspora]